MISKDHENVSIFQDIHLSNLDTLLRTQRAKMAPLIPSPTGSVLVLALTLTLLSFSTVPAPASVDAFSPPPSRATSAPTLPRLNMNKKKKAAGSGGGFGSSSAASKKKKSVARSTTAASSTSTAAGGFKFAGDIRPGQQTPQRTVPGNLGITFPNYAADGRPKDRPTMLPWVIEVKTPDEIKKMRAAGRVAREVLDLAGRAVRVGIATDEIDELVHEATLKVS